MVETTTQPGELPRGPRLEDGHGEIRLDVAVDPASNTVIIRFRGQVGWAHFEPDDARAIAAEIIQKAYDIDGR